MSQKLSRYNQKRRFDSTAEPEGKVKRGKSKQLEFVVQKHDASHLHYDFRLEMGGVLKSWAVPKGPSLNPQDKRLAMMTEDHPYDYRKFEGVIAKGNYGAGEVIVWDRGTYEPLKKTNDPEKELLGGLYRGHISFILHGEKLGGEFTLAKSPNMGENAWLLIKKHDKFSSIEDILAEDHSVLSNQTISSLKADDGEVDISAAPDSDYPKNVKPMLATLTNEPFDGDDWLFEIKWDGYRAIGSWDGKSVELYSRNGTDFRARYGPVTEALRNLKKPAVIDGEIVIVDDEGKSNFTWLQNYQHSRAKGTLLFYAFDILWYDGKDLTGLPLIKRKEMLKTLLKGNQTIRYSDHVKSHGKKFFAQVSKMQLEGMMAKKVDSIYRTGFRSKLWLKVKTHRRQEVVIGGFTEPKGSRDYIGALLTGVYEEGKLIFSGHVGGGIPPDILADLRSKLEGLEIKTSPFANIFRPNGAVHWVKPALLCEVSFEEWTSDFHMRQPIFVGLREDKDPMDVVREEPAVKVKESGKEPQVNENRINFTHLSKVFWPDMGYTKGDLLDYYRKVGPTMLDYVKDHPVNLLRHPNGIKGKSFYQKDMEGIDLPDFAETVAIFSESNQKEIHYYVIKNLDSLLYLVQLGCIEINPWSSRLGSLENPLWAVIDLDPHGVDFEQVVEVALEVKKVCDRLGISCYPKTSGQGGIHVFIPTAGKYSYTQVRQFAELIANLVHQATDPLTSLVRDPKKRPNKLYLDYLQNRESQTLAAPYSVRPRPQATVSAPLKWEEVNKKLRPTDYTLKNMPDRIKDIGDLWKPVIGKGVDLASALGHLK